MVQLRTVGDDEAARTLAEYVAPAYSMVQRSSRLVASSARSSKYTPCHCPAAGAGLLVVSRMGRGTVPAATSAPRLTLVPTKSPVPLLKRIVEPGASVSVTSVVGELPMTMPPLNAMSGKAVSGHEALSVIVSPRISSRPAALAPWSVLRFRNSATSSAPTREGLAS